MEDVIIKIDHGQLKGTIGLDQCSKKFYKFLGIPYAKPPIGNLRFKDPQPPEKWSGILDASEEKKGCYARSFFNPSQVIGSEDCLYLNIYTKKLSQNRNKPLPVMFYIHGGGFVYGPSTSDVYGPEFLMTEDIVLVVISYRLGLLGFLSFDDPILGVPGNAGFKDMVMALKWVQNNIQYFNGDKNNVTIFGESAGGAAVHLLMLSPMSKGLFHRAIAQSGCGLCAWAKGRNCFLDLCNILHLTDVSEAVMLEKLSKLPVEELLKIQDKLPDDLHPNVERIFGYVIEKPHFNAFLTEDPIDMILEGKAYNIPFMTGYTSIDGFGMVMNEEQNPSSLLDNQHDLPFQLGYVIGHPKTHEIAEKIKSFYSQDSRNDVDKFTDVMTLYFAYVAIKHHSLFSYSSSYLYRFSLDTCLNLYKILNKISIPGAAHVDDLGYLFKNFATPQIESNSIEEISWKKVVKLWTNFAKYGNPTPEQSHSFLEGNSVFAPVKGEIVTVLDINTELIPQVIPEMDRINFWKKLFADSPSGTKYV